MIRDQIHGRREPAPSKTSLLESNGRGMKVCGTGECSFGEKDDRYIIVRRRRAILFSVLLAFIVAKPLTGQLALNAGRLSDSAWPSGMGRSSGTVNNPVNTSLCELLLKPDLFNGKMVRLRAVVHVGFESTLLVDATCKTTDVFLDFPARMWLQFEEKSGENEHGIIVRKDEEYEKLGRLLRAQAAPHGKKIICADCPRYTVTATVVGRFDHISDPDPNKRFGSGAWKSQLVLESVSEIVARPYDKTLFHKPHSPPSKVPKREDAAPAPDLQPH